MATDFKYIDERFADLQMLRYHLDNFNNLSLRRKIYVYYLSEAALAGRDITTDQFGKYNIRLRKTLEAVYQSYAGSQEEHDFKEFEIYLKRLWFSNGIYHHYGCEKFVPGFSESFLRQEIHKLRPSDLPLHECETIDGLCDELLPVIFDPEVLPKRVNKHDGVDLLKTSACNFYDGVTQGEAERFYDAKPTSGEPLSYGLNSKLVKKDGVIEEDVYSVNGLYGDAIKMIISWLYKAREVAENERQRKVIDLLVSYYQSGDLRAFNEYCVEWLKEQEGDVDFINGFIETYGDPLGIKGSWEGIVEYVDIESTKRTSIICDNAQWFEDHSPVSPRFRKPVVKGVTAKGVCAAMLGGDEYPSSAIGINLPNADWIRTRHGSKSVTISNLTDAYRKTAHDSGFNDEFVIDDETRALIDRFGDVCDDLHTDLHECLGHGSGQLLAGIDSGALKSYGDVIEEARADLFGLYYIADEKIVDLGLLPDKNAYKAGYYTYVMNGLMTQLVRVERGHDIEEAHMRNRSLIAHWVRERGNGVVELVNQGGKTYVAINDYATLRGLFAELLAEVQRVKSEGDYAAARDLIENYGVKVNDELHGEVRSRYEKLDLAPYKGFINPWMKPRYNANGEITGIELDYAESYAHQMLRYSKEYGLL